MGCYVSHARRAAWHAAACTAHAVLWWWMLMAALLVGVVADVVIPRGEHGC